MYAYALPCKSISFATLIHAEAWDSDAFKLVMKDTSNTVLEKVKFQLATQLRKVLKFEIKHLRIDKLFSSHAS